MKSNEVIFANHFESLLPQESFLNVISLLRIASCGSAFYPFQAVTEDMQTRLRQVAFDLVQTSFESYLNISQTNCESEISDCRWNVYTFEIWQKNSSLAGPGWIELSSRCAGSRVSRPTAQWKGATFFSKRSTVLHVHFSMFPPLHCPSTT